MLITTMNLIFQTDVTKLVQMAHKMAQMTKDLCCIELSQNRYSANFKDADYEYGHDF